MRSSQGGSENPGRDPGHPPPVYDDLTRCRACSGEDERNGMQVLADGVYQTFSARGSRYVVARKYQ